MAAEKEMRFGVPGAGEVSAVRDDGLVVVDLTATVTGQTVLAKARAVVHPPS